MNMERMAFVQRRGPFRVPCLLAALAALTLCSEMGVGPKPLVASTAASKKAPQWKEEQTANSSRAEPFGPGYLEEAFKEQGYYLQRLFLQYGDNGTLSYGGLKRLLGSLGLGEVNVLQISQQGLKHIPPSSQNLHPHDGPAAPPHILESGSSGETGSEWGAEDTVGPAEVYHRPASGKEGQDHLELPRAPHPQPGQTHPEGPSFEPDHPIKTHLHGNCLNVTQLLWNFGLGKASHITPSHFTFLCPALLYQIESGVCLRHPEGEGLEAGKSGSFLVALGWGFLALVVISLPSLLALALVPLVPPARLQTLLCPMAALAMGTLCGDALLHLLPHARTGSHSESEQRDSVLKGASVLAGLYLFFLVEGTMGLQRHFKRKVRKTKQDSPSAQGGRAPERELDALHDVTLIESAPPPERLSVEEHGHGHSHGPPSQGHSGTGSLVWMVVMGDGIHNLTDGLAIGVAFSQGLAGGLSTTVAVFCHELPHELGDLALLLGAGWPVRRLLVFSGASAALGLLGLLAGTVLGHHFAALSPWILSLTAGVFLYVALVDMTPEMLHGDRGPMRPLTRFFLQNLGLLTGGAIMLCIALFEDSIAFNLGDV
ncbi:zinc transporter ZIP5 [Anguilla rostrata]|uniref:zinc transporter ZIP5 n=1 Tax=Anguilla rostrata TaxID=7938 RepID=UPI0030D1D9A6